MIGADVSEGVPSANKEFMVHRSGKMYRPVIERFFNGVPHAYLLGVFHRALFSGLRRHAEFPRGTGPREGNQ
jgi:hypothetical protein